MKEPTVNWHFPRAGIDVSRAFSKQPNRQTREIYSRTCVIGNNVRAVEAITNMSRGGSRSGMSKAINAKVNGATFVIQMLATIVITNASAQL